MIPILYYSFPTLLLCVTVLVALSSLASPEITIACAEEEIQIINMATPHNNIVPGTVHLIDVGGDMNARHLEGSKKDIVLVPKPSSDPEDPLNWTRKRKLLAIWMSNTYTIGTAISTAVQYSGTTAFKSRI